MTKINLEELARRVDALEKRLDSAKVGTNQKDWRWAIGFFGESEFMQRVIAEGKAIRESDCSDENEAASN